MIKVRTNKCGTSIGTQGYLAERLVLFPFVHTASPKELQRVSTLPDSHHSDPSSREEGKEKKWPTECLPTEMNCAVLSA